MLSSPVLLLVATLGDGLQHLARHGGGGPGPGVPATQVGSLIFGLQYLNSLMRMRIPGSGNLFDPGFGNRDGKNSNPR